MDHVRPASFGSHEEQLHDFSESVLVDEAGLFDRMVAALADGPLERQKFYRAAFGCEPKDDMALCTRARTVLHAAEIIGHLATRTSRGRTFVYTMDQAIAELQQADEWLHDFETAFPELAAEQRDDSYVRSLRAMVHGPRKDTA